MCASTHRQLTSPADGTHEAAEEGESGGGLQGVTADGHTSGDVCRKKGLHRNAVTAGKWSASRSRALPIIDSRTRTRNELPLCRSRGTSPA